jgi:hypothetical protein
MKHLLSLILGVSTLFGFGACDTCKKVPLTVAVDLSKKGTVYETDFQAPWNIWGSLVQFNIGVGYFVNADITALSQLTKEQQILFLQLTKEQQMISDAIRTGYIGHNLIPKRENQYFKLKVTLTPLGWASDEIDVVWEMGEWDWDSKRWLNRKEKHYSQGEKIEEVVSVPLYGGGDILMLADLQRLRNYHVRIESLEDVELPKGVSTNFKINRFSRKH